MDGLQRNPIIGRRYAFLCLVLFALCLKADAFAGTWASQTSGTPEDLFSVHFVSATQGWAVGANSTIRATANGGANWTAQTSTTAFVGRGVRFISSSIGWAGGGPAVIRTTDGGGNWVSLGGDPTLTRNNIFATSAATAWASGTNVTNFGFGRYTDPATEQIFDVTPGADQYLDLFFIGTNDGWAAGTSGLIRRITAASAATPGFAAQTSGVVAQLNGIHMVNAIIGYIVGNAGTILKTINGGANWTPQTSGIPGNLFSVSCIDANRCWAVGDLGVIRRTINGGAT